jgi:hypothetical protein
MFNTSLKAAVSACLIFLCTASSIAQTDSLHKVAMESMYFPNKSLTKEKPKVLHAEPLYIDLIRDLGARKGEKEWNIGLGLTDKTESDEYSALIEYEFAPIDRLGLEVELPFSFYYPSNGVSKDSIQANKLNSLKMAAQYTFLVSEKANTSLAIGYLHEFTLTDFNKYGKSTLFEGNIFNPFFIAAKSWRNNIHTLIYTGPEIYKARNESSIHSLWQINSNIHYMIPRSRNFIGIEFNKELSKNNFDMVIRPQMRIGLADNLLVGIVTGIPISKNHERLSSFLRLIYEPGHKQHNTK